MNKKYVILGVVVIVVLILGRLSYVIKKDSDYRNSSEYKSAVQKADQKQAEAQKVQAEKEAAELAAWQQTPAGKLCAKHSTWKKDECEKLIDNEVWVGMKYEQLVYLRGEPSSTNPSDYGNGVSYQYCWRGMKPFCFYDRNADGVLDAFN